jgi:hypothetical protein
MVIHDHQIDGSSKSVTPLVSFPPIFVNSEEIGIVGYCKCRNPNGRLYGDSHMVSGHIDHGIAKGANPRWSQRQVIGESQVKTPTRSEPSVHTGQVPGIGRRRHFVHREIGKPVDK